MICPSGKQSKGWRGHRRTSTRKGLYDQVLPAVLGGDPVALPAQIPTGLPATAAAELAAAPAPERPARTGRITPAVASALERIGFSREGLLRGVRFRHGKWRDMAIYGLLHDEVRIPLE